MNFLDVAITLVLLASVFLGFRDGIIRTTFSLGGMVIGVAFAGTHFERFAKELEPLVPSLAIAEVTWFVLLVMAAMVAAALLGHQVQAAVDWNGLGVFDRVLGFTLGALRGIAFAVIGVMMAAAFFPQSDEFLESSLTPRLINPTVLFAELISTPMKKRVYEGLQSLPAVMPGRDEAH